MLENFEPGVIPALKLLMQILKRVDSDSFDLISLCGDVPTFTLSWVLTWYAHIIDDFRQVQRLYDACLAHSPLFPLYLTVATILVNKEALIEQFDEDDPHTSLYIVF
jgi:hypothetical protein